MLRLLEDLPVELVGTNVLGYLSLKDIVLLERACGSKKSHQAFMEQIPHRPPVVIPSSKHTNIETKKQGDHTDASNSKDLLKNQFF